MRFKFFVFLLSTLCVCAQTAILDTDGDGLEDQEEARYGLSPYLADTNLNGRPDLHQVNQWEIVLPADQPLWTAEWMPDVNGTYRFTLNVSEPIEFRVNDTVIPAYSGNTYEVTGLVAEKLTLAVERTNAGPLPAGTGMLAASFIDGMDADGDGLSLDWEMALHLDPAKPDTDGDGLTDGEEVLRYSTDPLSADTNQNGLPDYVEVLTLTGSQAIDSEGYWEEKLDSMATRVPTKALLYRFPFPYEGTYRLGVVTHPDSTARGTLKFYVEGTLRGQIAFRPGPGNLYHWIDLIVVDPVNAADGRPSLSHLVRIEWENKTPGADAGELLIQQVYVDFIDDREDPIISP